MQFSPFLVFSNWSHLANSSNLLSEEMKAATVLEREADSQEERMEADRWQWWSFEDELCQSPSFSYLFHSISRGQIRREEQSDESSPLLQLSFRPFKEKQQIWPNNVIIGSNQLLWQMDNLSFFISDQ